MPGLVGIFHQGSKQIDLALFQLMMSSVNHKMFYRSTVVIDKHKKYAAADVSLPTIKYSEQPFIANNGSITILMHGEIYNDDADPLNQLEYIYKLYQKFDIKFPIHLNGSFVILIIDELKKCVIIANDRTASRPLLYFRSGGAFYCTPELKTLFLLPSLRMTLNLSAVASFLSCGYLLDGETWLENVQALDNATILILSDEGTQFIKYWNYMFDEDPKDLGTDYYRHVLSDLLLRSVRNRLRSPHKYGVLLSGGYDSRGILGCVLREKDPGEVNTISWGTQEDIDHSDCAVAKRLSEKLGVRHTFYHLDSRKIPFHLKEFVYLSDGMTDA
ncbi:MAG: asparagine synthase-related protein [Candidatus Entotheonellia bacterium]